MTATRQSYNRSASFATNRPYAEKSSIKPLKTLIIDNYDSFTYNLHQYVAELNGNPMTKKNDQITIKEIKKLKPTHIVISPGPGTPTRKKDFGICKKIIKHLKGKIPILGVCLGHQGIIAHFKGRIEKAPEIIHGKSTEIRIIKKSKLFQGMPKIIKAMRYHSLIGTKIPKELVITSVTKNKKLVMSVEHKTMPLYGVQFHPESIGTPHGKRILRNFLR